MHLFNLRNQESSPHNNLYKTSFYTPTFGEVSHGKYIYYPPNYLYPKQRRTAFPNNEYQSISYLQPLPPNIDVAYVSSISQKPKFGAQKSKKKYYWTPKVSSKKNRFYPKHNQMKKKLIYHEKFRSPEPVYLNTQIEPTKAFSDLPIQRLFDKPLIASEEAAMSYECTECDKRGMDCMVVMA